MSYYTSVCECTVRQMLQLMVHLTSHHEMASAKEIISKKGIQQISDSSEVEALVKEIISSNPDEVARLKGGDEKLLGFFVGQVMKATKGKANPKVVNDIIKKLI